VAATERKARLVREEVIGASSSPFDEENEPLR
jgi:hypothetical protein